MYEFYKIKLLLICICTIIGSFEEVNGIPKNAVEQKVVPLSDILKITGGKLERNKRGLFDYLLAELYEYFDYSDEDDSEEDEKYLICRNCTVIISQSGVQGNTTIKPPVAPTIAPTATPATITPNTPTTPTPSTAATTPPP